MFADLKGKSALVTGGTRGIGAAIARRLARAGCDASVCGRRADAMSAPPEFGDLRVLAADVTSDDSVAALVAGFARIDILVNCAGTIRRRDEYELPVFHDVLSCNLEGTARLCLAAKSKFPSAGGAIVNIASMLCIFGAPHAPAYAASKGGVAQLTKSLAAAWAPDGIRVNAVAPGWIRTPLTEPIRNDRSREATILAHADGPLGRARGSGRCCSISVLFGRAVRDRCRLAGRRRLLDCVIDMLAGGLQSE